MSESVSVTVTEEELVEAREIVTRLIVERLSPDERVEIITAALSRARVSGGRKDYERGIWDALKDIREYSVPSASAIAEILTSHGMENYAPPVDQGGKP